MPSGDIGRATPDHAAERQSWQISDDELVDMALHGLAGRLKPCRSGSVGYEWKKQLKRLQSERKAARS